MQTLLLLAAALAQPPAAPKPPAQPLKFDIRDWTPRPASKGEPWETKKDPDWDDPRFRSMDTGPFFDATFKFPLNKTQQQLVYKGVAVRLKSTSPNPVEGGVIFDRATCRLMAGWTGGYLEQSIRRFGLLNTPTPKGQMLFANPAGPGWADANGKWDAKGPFTAPLSKEWVRYKGIYVKGDRVTFQYTVGGTEVLETAKLVVANNKAIIHLSISVSPHEKVLSHFEQYGIRTFGPSQISHVYTYSSGQDPNFAPEDVVAFTKPGPRRWGEPIITKFVKGDETGPFAIDTYTIPYDNRFKALFFCTGLDFLPDGRLAVCTCHGDVWLVKQSGDTCSWQRFATGLYQPLGLKVVDGKIVVHERGQLTRLHDLNNNGEADFYECIANDWDTGQGEHSYDTCLETDPQGNFYHFKTGDTDLPTGGTLLKTAKDGSKTEIYCTGFRHPIGLGISPTGIVTGADQEGNYMPATRVDEYKPGGFYGDLRAHHRMAAPKIYDGPLTWIPREVDNSAGGQVWMPEKTFGPLAGLPIHFSYGRCKAFVLLRQVLSDGTVQGGVADLGLHFLSGVCRGRFGPDGNLYTCGLNGWQTAAKADGSLQRVRYTGKPITVPVKLSVVPTGVRLTFAQQLDPVTATNPKNFNAAWWNYRWSADYGSKRWKVSNPRQEGQDDLPVKGAKLIDGHTVEIQVRGMRPAMQMHTGFNIKTAD
ncbi:MAG TPA: DUF6797 domain-containing protein, partial [Fimbriiglobus sp.]